MNRNLFFFCVLITGIFIMTATAGSVSAEPGITKDQILIGQSCDLSGTFKELGKEAKNGATAYFSHINASGGVKGRKIKLVTLDDSYDVSKCVANTDKLLNQENVFLLFGYLGAPTIHAVLETVKKNNVPFFAPLTGAEFLRNPMTREVFNIRASYIKEIETIIEALLMKNIKRISVFYMEADYGTSGLAAVEAELKMRGMNIHSKASYPPDSKDIRPAVASLSASEPEAVIIIAANSASAAFIEEMRARKSKPMMINLSPVGGDLLAKNLKNRGVGVVVTQVMPFPFDKRVPVVAEYHRISEAFTPEAEISYSGLEGFIAAKTLCSILSKMQAFTRREFIETAELTYEYVGGYKINYTPANHFGSVMVQLTQIAPGGFLGNVENLNQLYE